MANKRGKSVDTTFLSVDHALERGFIHRDYISHVLRWSHAVKLATKMYKDCLRVLDAGCGVESPLARTLYSSRIVPDRFVAVDYGPIKQSIVTDQPWFKAIPHQDLATLTLEQVGTKCDLITMFEVIEHVEPLHGASILRNLHSLLDEDGRFLMSTPCYDERVGTADNHVNEIKLDVLGWMLEECGWTVVDYWGTFASQRDYKPFLAEHGLVAAFDELSSYYDSNVMAVLFAPLFPRQSRNCLWELKKRSLSDGPRRFTSLDSVGDPWSSSALWRDYSKLV